MLCHYMQYLGNAITSPHDLFVCVCVCCRTHSAIFCNAMLCCVMWRQACSSIYQPGSPLTAGKYTSFHSPPLFLLHAQNNPVTEACDADVAKTCLKDKSSDTVPLSAVRDCLIKSVSVAEEAASDGSAASTGDAAQAVQEPASTQEAAKSEEAAQTEGAAGEETKTEAKAEEGAPLTDAAPAEGADPV